MPAIYPSSIIAQRLQIAETAIDAAGGNGNLRILDGTNNVLSTLQLARPAGVVSGSVLTFNSLPLVDPAASASGFAKAARIEDSGGHVVISGLTVGNSTDVDISISNGIGNTFIAAGQTVALTAATLTGH